MQCFHEGFGSASHQEHTLLSTQKQLLQSWTPEMQRRQCSP